MTDEEKQKLAAEVKVWRGRSTSKEAAAALGIPPRTLEGIEQGRGFSYPGLLRLGMRALKIGGDYGTRA
ncbi:XRE family transcriptional regulator [Rhizobium mongolense]|uniref:XRE family transcriptional regulator n=1 Tax=Rhizobium TaxID=379 RepID=UPI0024B08F17|nr:XRE family transcriptional regulator [Rhizobium sp. CC1099]WFU88875.1 XRE family transcriptional regulator [Rhizobium sp. CC1099]